MTGRCPPSTASDMKRRKAAPLSPFYFTYRGVRVQFSPHDLDIAMNFNMDIYVDGEQVTLDREESMRFVYEYFIWLNNL